jgi:signal transduction histidine kinase
MPYVKPSRLAVLVVFAAVMLALTWGSLALTRHMGTVAAVWPIDALATAFCVRWSRGSTERSLVAILTGLAICAADVAWGGNPGPSFALAMLNVVDVGFSVWLLRRLGRPLDNLKACAAFVAGPCLAAPMLTGAGAAAVFAATDPHADPVQVFLRWTLAAGLGMAIVGSFALTVRRNAAAQMTGTDWTRLLAGQAVVLVFGSFLLMRTQPPALFLLPPILVIGAMSHRELGGITAVTLTAIICVVGTLLGRGPAQIADLAHVDRNVLMQALLASMVFTVLPISALLQRLHLAAAELEERRARAEALNEVKSRLLAYVSHEIRSPLSGVTTLAALLRDGQLGDLTAEQRAVLDQITATGAEVDALARDLTDTAAIQSGKASVRLVPVQVGEAIRSAVHLARFRTAQHAATLESPTSHVDALEVMADPLRLRQILVNLLVNGAKYGGRPPLVRISARRTTRGVIRFEVSDNGLGLPPEQRDALFAAFERLGQEKSEMEGTGLGLALSREMASVQNGVMGVEDGELGGLRFWLELPAAQLRSVAA